MEETPILSSENQTIEELRAVHRELVAQCAVRHEENEKKLEKCRKQNNKLQDKINQLNATIQILEAEIESLKNVRSAPIREPVYSTTYFGENVLAFGDCDPTGNSLDLLNRSDICLPLGNFTIRQIFDETTVEISMPRGAKIQPGSTLKIYGKASTIDEETQRIVLDDIERWSSGKSVQTFLLDKHGAEVASIFQSFELSAN